MFVLPNLFTVSSIFCGFYAMVLCLDTPSPLELRRAALAIFFGMFFDMFDGRVARLTRTQSEFGMQLDSLADVVTFGAAPAVLLYRWDLNELGMLGLFGAFLFVACGALRLARFNVLAARDVAGGGGGGKYFVGLPIPLAAGAVVAAVLATFPYERSVGGELLVRGAGGSTLHLSSIAALVGTVGLALLMVSTVHYQTFKKVRPGRRSISVAFAIALTFGLVAMLSKPAIALALLFMVYICAGIFEHILRLARQSGPEGEPPGGAGPSEHAAPKEP